jgi:hypothetical protein
MANGARLDSSASGSGWHATPAPSGSTHSRIIASSSHPFAPSVLFWVELKTRQKLDTKCCFLFICLAPKTLTPDRLLFCFRGIFERPRSKIKAYRAQSSLCTLLCLCLRTAPAEGRFFFFRIISHCPSSGRSAGMLCRSHVFYSGDLSGCGAGWCDVSNGCPSARPVFLYCIVQYFINAQPVYTIWTVPKGCLWTEAWDWTSHQRTGRLVRSRCHTAKIQ